MPDRGRPFIDVKFNEYVFEILSNATIEQKKLLSPKELKMLSKDFSIKRFANNAPYHKVDVLLSKMGIYQAKMYFCPSKLETPGIFKKVFSQTHLEERGWELMQNMIEQKIFVIDSRSISLSLSMMSMHCHSDVFQINTDMLKIRKSLTKIQEAAHNRNINLVYKDHTSAFKDICKVMMKSIILSKTIESKFNLTIKQLQILLALIGTPNNYSSIPRIARLTSVTNQWVIQNCAILFKDRQLIDRAATKKGAYRITNTGILLIGEVVNYIINHENV